jgi:hypothetical protein
MLRVLKSHCIFMSRVLKNHSGQGPRSVPGGFCGPVDIQLFFSHIHVFTGKMINSTIAVLDYRGDGDDLFADVAADGLGGNAELSGCVRYGSIGMPFYYDHKALPSSGC